MNQFFLKEFSELSIFACILLVGYIDYITGIEVRVYPLYLIPLAMAAISYGKRGALAASLVTTMAWTVSQYLGGRAYSQPYIWAINFTTQISGFVVVSLLVSSLQDALSREQKLGRTDTLTGLLNSRAFYENAEIALALCHRGNRPVTLAFIDLDNFKNVNDTAGHQRGDDLLKKVAAVLSKGVRSSDLVARLGGDEFAIFLPETDELQAQVVLEKIRTQLLHTDDFTAFAVSASIGAAAYEIAPNSLNDMIKEADTLMYAVKAAGRNAVKIQKFSSLTK